MKIGVLGDSHLQRTDIDKVLLELKGVDFLIHTGDLYLDFEYLIEKLEVKGIGVKGNCDYKGEKEIIQDIHGKRFLVCHGHEYGVKSNLNSLFYRGREVNADIVVFGHSHVPVYAIEENMILLNPGSIAYPRGGSRKSYAILWVDSEIRVEFKYLE